MRVRTLAAALFALVALPGSATASPLQRLDAPADLKVISYYPVDAGWTEMWTHWEPGNIAADLDRAASLHANTVRVIIQPDTFGYPDPAPINARHLQDFVTLAAARGLHVQLTLFDWWYRWPDRRGSKTWLRELLSPYAGDPRIAFVELRNEILPKPETCSWAKDMIRFIRTVSPATPVTLSVAGRDPVTRLAVLKKQLGSVRPDFFDLHYFGDGGANAYADFAAAKAIAAPTPLWIGETGYSTTPAGTEYGGVPLTASAQEAAQQHFLALTAWAARANGLADNGIWVLNDFVPAAIPDRVAPPGDPDLHYGLFRVDGTAKPAADTVRTIFDNGLPLSFNEGFEQGVPDATRADVPAQWEMSGRHMSFADDSTVAATGAASARLTPLGIGTGSFSIVPPNGGVRADEAVSVSVWARRADLRGRVFVVLEWSDRFGHLLRRDASAPLTEAADVWSQLFVAGRAPTDAASVRIDLVGQRIAGPVWFDDVAFSPSG